MRPRAAAERSNPYDLIVAPERFEEHMRLISEVFEPSELGERNQPSRRPRAIVTFDDGYADNLQVAAPITEKFGIPIIVYVTTALLGDTRGFWWDRLAAICARICPEAVAESASLQVAGSRLVLNLRDAGATGQLRRDVHQLLRPLRRPVIDAALDELARQVEVDPSGDADAPVLSVPEVVQLSKLSHVVIGAHTADHDLLSALSSAEQDPEIRSSLQALEGITGAPVLHFAYPYGGPGDMNGDTMRALRDMGVHTAVTTTPGRVDATTPPLQLPRFMITPYDTPSDLLAQSGFS
jgi:peptidoglycan/xylan/chitin deacetylase (PgdA/CDA1 family)